MLSIAVSLPICHQIHWLRSPVSPSVTEYRCLPSMPPAVRIAASALGAFRPPTRWAPLAAPLLPLSAIPDLPSANVEKTHPASSRGPEPDRLQSDGAAFPVPRPVGEF